MADDVDRVNEHAERDHGLLLKATRRPVGPAPNGHCLFCGEQVADGIRFCCVECRDDFERQMALERLR